MNVTSRTQFTFYANYRDTADLCTTVEGRLEWYDAIVGFALDGAEPEFRSADAKALYAAWINVRPHLSKAHQRSRAAKKRNEARIAASGVAASGIPTDDFFDK